MQLRQNNILLSWPDESQQIQLNVVEEPDEDPVDITEFVPFFLERYWGESAFEEGQKTTVEFAEIIYPDNIRIYRNGKRTSLMEAHAAVESGLNFTLRAALNFMEAQQQEEASHSQA